MNKQPQINADEHRSLVPKLRFPEFRDKGEWEEVRLGQLGELVSGLTYSPDDIRDKGLLVLRSSNVQNGVISLEDNVYVRTDIKGANLSKPNDILICVRNGSKHLIGKNALIPEGMPLSTHGAFMAVFRATYAKFVFQLFQTSAYKVNVTADLGATINSINGNQFKKYEFYVPKLEREQQKIADCLSSIDNLITAQAQKVETLKAHKKGLMQKLFPAEGKTVPELRFPEFRDKGEWEEKPLGKYIKEFREKTTSKNEFEVLTSARNGLIKQKDYFDSNRITARDNIGFNIIPPDYITYRSRSDNRRFFFNINDIGITGIVSSYYPVFHIIDGNNRFLSNFLSNHWIYIGKYSVGTSQTVLSMNELKCIKLPLPAPPEQRKIADCLSSIDDLINSQTQKLENLQVHKKGLMQQLFPSTGAVDR